MRRGRYKTNFDRSHFRPTRHDLGANYGCYSYNIFPSLDPPGTLSTTEIWVQGCKFAGVLHPILSVDYPAPDVIGHHTNLDARRMRIAPTISSSHWALERPSRPQKFGRAEVQKELRFTPRKFSPNQNCHTYLMNFPLDQR